MYNVQNGVGLCHISFAVWAEMENTPPSVSSNVSCECSSQISSSATQENSGPPSEFCRRSQRFQRTSKNVSRSKLCPRIRLLIMFQVIGRHHNADCLWHPDRPKERPICRHCRRICQNASRECITWCIAL
jgi:hypothetical protein